MIEGTPVLVFGVVLFTLFAQGATADLVVRRLIPAEDVEASAAPEQASPRS